ncbi:MAG: SurA N-terminal domain-containing protein [Ottowia sp.]|nr:SurA N-terminal domain-containing protein [Ottowia sp.]
MFDFIRHHTKLFMVVLFVLVFPAFALWGIGGYSRMGSTAKVAVVDGKAITQADWDQAHRQRAEQVRRSNPQLNLAVLDTPQMRYNTLEGLVRDRVLAVAAQKQRLLVSDVALAQALQSDPVIASLRKDDGTLDMDAYARLAAQQGLTPQGFEASVRAQLARQQVLGGVVDTSFASQSTAQLALNAFAERREVRLQRFEPKNFKDKVNISDADLEAFYQKNPSRAPESADIEYLVLSAEDLKAGLTPSEEELRSYYEQNAATLGAPEERRAAHILINAPKDAPAAERDAARQKAQELLDEVKKAPDTFAAVARRASQDDVSAPNGGDLGRFVQGKDSGLDAALTAAIFAIEKEGGISPELVESEFGWHIVRLTSLKPAALPSFEEAKERIADAWRAQEAPRRYNEAAEEFRNIVYEQPDSLAPAAERFGLKVQGAKGITRTPAPDAAAPLNDERLLAALFTTDAIEKKHNTEAQETGSQQLVSARITKHTPARTLPLAEVREQALAALTAQRTAELAAEEGASQLKALQDGGSDKALGKAITVSRTDPAGLPPQAVEAILRLDATKLPATTGVPLGTGGYLIARVEKTLPPEENAAQLAETRQLYEQAWAMSEAQNYYELLAEQYGAKILAPRPSADATE